MKERPILFSGSMVRALLDGSKTQTRRIIKVQPPADGFQLTTCMSTTGDRREEGKHRWAKVDGVSIVEGGKDYFACPHGYPGDRLWVRETFASSAHGPTAAVLYRADNHVRPGLGDFDGEPWRPSIFMPRAASRINLEIIGVRVERLQDCSEADAIAEGISVWSDNERHGKKWHCPPHIQRFGEGDNVEDVAYEGRAVKDPREAYRGVWSAINGPGSWEANPWVWAIEFRRAQ